MSIINIPIGTNFVPSDDTATVSSLVRRDVSGGINGKIITATALISTGTIAGGVSVQTASFTAGAARNYACDCTSAAITATLPAASANVGVEYHFTKTDSVTGHALTFATPLGVTSITAQESHVRIWSDGTNWHSAV